MTHDKPDAIALVFRAVAQDCNPYRRTCPSAIWLWTQGVAPGRIVGVFRDMRRAAPIMMKERAP